ncbi:MAG: hypothetical protein R3F18_18985 [Lysobacterales bacterium]|nr:hypothetical protein [Xanthomonadales bacterium]MCB1612036.1 hypothetical protein [Xanthomonadales bacterium]MCP5476555.1 hypothetical protein [Rhodanobacteraceae bacterium]
MHNFEDIRSHLASRHQLNQNQPFVISLDLNLPAGRVQSLFLADIETEDGKRLLRMSTPVAPLARLPAEKCLRFNWAQRVGFLAVDDLDGTAYVHLCENRGYGSLSTRELDRVLNELGSLADGLESLVSPGEDRT